MLYPLIQFCVIILHMLVTGIFWGPWFSLHRSLNVFNAEELIHIVKTLAVNLALPMRIMMPLCVLFIMLSTWFYPQKNSLGFYLNITALSLTLISLIITIAIEIPIVNQFKQWTVATLPSNWETIRDKWVKFHEIRTFASLASFACLTASYLLL